MTWRVLPPASLLARWRTRRRALAILRELDMEGPDAQPVREPGSPGAVAWLWVLAAALAVSAVSLGRLPPSTWRSHREPVALAPGPVVSDAFPDARRAFERLAGAPAVPLVVEDAVGSQHPVAALADELRKSRELYCWWD